MRITEIRNRQRGWYAAYAGGVYVASGSTLVEVKAKARERGWTVPNNTPVTHPGRPVKVGGDKFS